ncbi:hypothetical protein [Limimaricola litoreus]|uniref:Uncharacterized protein n=1 Tax=Limimaricola litoreus TaxID=2955316 RepID=A0A9X2JNJ1_9RHOB|nr:hypothetical protein [Limimaricola litoreus]MCP1168912.1 hypothetical protein [Limimaricola litoreus]
MIEAPFEAITMQVPELRHLLDKAETTWRRALSERQVDLVDETFAEVPDIVDEIGASVERIEVALDDLFVMRAAYVFGDREEVRVPVEDLMNLLMETDFG